jgi:lysophospholipase L1-like esterase
LVTSKVNVQVGLPITYTLSASSEQTITLSDTKGGIFSTTGIILNVSNNYTDSLTYIPTKAGSATITASGNDEVKTSQIFASPYATVIGYIGDSITQGVGGTPNAVQVATTQLGTGFTVVNRGVSGSTTKSRVNSQLADAITAFQSNGVEVVSIMLGTNDAQISNNISVNDYKTNVETIITQLKVAGIKKIILNEPPYLDIAKFSSNYNNDSLVKLREYSVMLEELADGETVIYGDTQTYEWFENHQ